MAITNTGITFDINNFDIHENYVIDASAGTGKTYSICEIVMKLIENGVSLDKITLLTYTEKAAGELKERIREKVEKKGLDIDVENSSISTIHAWCQNIISEFCVSSGKPSMLGLEQDNGIKDFVKRYIREGDIYKEICELKAAKPIDNIEDSIVDTFCELLKNYYLDSEWKVVDEIVRMAPLPDEDEHQKFLDGEKIETIFPELITHIENVRDGSYKKAEKFYSTMIDLLAENTIKIDGRSFKEQDFVDKKDIEAYQYIKDVEKKIKNWEKDKNFPIFQLVQKYINDLYKLYQLNKEKRSVQTFDDMLRTVREQVVNESPLLEKIREKYSHAIIDEFQDTNRLQWDIFNKVFLESSDHHIIVVGDEKQSIYAFQGAQIEVYKLATEEIVNKGGQKRVLSKNYRASQAMINGVNKFFDQDEFKEFDYSDVDCGKGDLKATFDGNDINEAFWIPNEPVIEYLYAQLITQRIIDCCTKVADGKTRLQIYEEKDGEEKGFLRNVTFNDFVVLARTRSEMTSVKDEFERCGVPYFMYKNKTLFTGKECAQFISLLEALEVKDFTGDNRAKFKKALFTLFFQVTFDEINDARYNKDSIPEARLFVKWKALYDEGRYEEMIDAILLDTKLAIRLSDDFKSYAAFKQLADYAVDYLAENHNLTSLIKKLKTLSASVADDEDNEGSDIVARGTDFDVVRMMTIHASKGLQFPIVISLMGIKGPNNTGKVHKYFDDGNVIVFDNEERCKAAEISEWKRLIYVAYTRAKFVNIIPCFAPKSNERNKEYKEFISSSASKYLDGMSPGDKAYAALVDNGDSADDLKKKVEAILSDARGGAVFDQKALDEQKDNLKKVIKGSFFNSSYKYTYSSLSHSKKEDTTVVGDKLTHSNAEDEIEETLAGFDKDGVQIPCDYDEGQAPLTLSPDYPMGAELGNALHEVFELIDYTDKNAGGDVKKLIEERFIGQGFKTSASGVITIKNKAWIDDTDKMIDNVLAAKFPGIKGSAADGTTFALSDITLENRTNEAEFNCNKEGEYLHRYFNGFVDLIFRRGDVYNVLDWKSDRLSDTFEAYNDGAELKKHVDELYSIQRVLYSYILIKWLKGFYQGKSESQIFEEHFGGVYYVFLRGCNAGCGNGIYAHTWDSFEKLEEAYKQIVSVKINRRKEDL